MSNNLRKWTVLHFFMPWNIRSRAITIKRMSYMSLRSFVMMLMMLLNGCLLRAQVLLQHSAPVNNTQRAWGACSLKQYAECGNDNLLLNASKSPGRNETSYRSVILCHTPREALSISKSSVTYSVELSLIPPELRRRFNRDGSHNLVKKKPKMCWIFHPIISRCAKRSFKSPKRCCFSMWPTVTFKNIENQLCITWIYNAVPVAQIFIIKATVLPRFNIQNESYDKNCIFGSFVFFNIDI